MDVSITPQTLEAHGRFVRRIARALLGDEGHAEDVAQETLTRWVLDPPPDRTRPRAWLAAVARSLARNRLRGDRTRAHHEAAAARGEELAGADEVVEHSDLLRRVVEAVQALDPLEREALLTRYYRGLSLRRAARELGVTVDVLRRRERRGLAALRSRLDRSNGRRGAWAGVLASLAQPSRALVWSGAAAALVLAGATGLAVMRPAASPTGRASALAAVPEVRPEGRTPANRREVVSDPSGIRASADRQELALVDPRAALLRVRFVDDQGRAIAGTSWTLAGWVGNTERVLEHGVPGDWADPSGETGADGTLEVVFVPPPAFQFSLDAGAPGFAAVSWRWGEVAPGARLELGDVRLRRAGAIVGQVVDAAGEPMIGTDWHLLVTSIPQPGAGRDETRAFPSFDSSTGTFWSESVLPGPNELSAHHPLAGELSTSITAIAGETVEVQLCYRGPELARRLVVATQSSPFFVPNLPPGAVRLETPEGEAWTPSPDSRLDRVVFDGLEPGAYRATVLVPGFQPWSREDARPGTVVEARLEPAASIVLTALGCSAVDAERFTVGGVEDGERGLERLLCNGAVPIERGGEPLVLPLLPGDWSLRVRAGGVRADTRVLDLVPGEARPVVVDLAARTVVTGRVVEADGEPSEDVDVFLVRPAAVDDDELSPILTLSSGAGDAQLYRHELAHATTDAEGRFELPLPPPGQVLLIAETRRGRRTCGAPFSIVEGQSVTGRELALPPAVTVHGRVVVPGAEACEGLSLTFEPERGPRWTTWWMARRAGALVPVAPDGTLTADDLPAGRLVARLWLHDALPREPSLTSGTWNGHPLAILDADAGQTLERSFTPSAWPGSVTLRVLVNGEPAAGASLVVEREQAGPKSSFQQTCDADGRCGPLRLFSGRWAATVQGQRSAGAIPFDVVASAHTEPIVAVNVFEGTLEVVDANGLPAEHRSLAFFADGPWSIARATTDAEGHAALVLATGRYEVRLDEGNDNALLKPGTLTRPLDWPPGTDEPIVIRF